jgi:hypothetical protein
VTVVIVYVWPQVSFHVYEPLARRFAESYLEHPPGQHDHQIKVVLNGGVSGPLHKKVFDPIPCEFVPHTNWGKDIGAYQMAASTWACDLLVCFGAHVRFPRGGWLDYMVRMYQDNGPALYGAYCFHQPSPHVRTTNFWMPPQLLQSYPHPIGNDQRYMFEHGGEHSFTRHCMASGYPAYQLTWNGVYGIGDWHHPTPEDALLYDQHTDRIPWK